MNRLWIICCALVMTSPLPLTTALAAQSFSFDTMLEKQDLDKDGQISQDEFRGAQAFWNKLDSDQDGLLTRKEFDERKKAFQKERARKRVAEDVTLHPDLEFAIADAQSLKLDLYLPKKSDTPPPLVMWIHGGGWRNGDKAYVNPAILRLSEQGYAVASINYRLKDLSIHPKHIHDCKSAARWLAAHAEEYGYDISRLAVGGGSAGGHLALLYGMSHDINDLEGEVGTELGTAPKARAIIDIYGPSDFLSFSKNNERFKRTQAVLEKQLAHASPLTYLTADDPPVLILHGDQDTTVPVQQSILLDQRYKELDLISELHVIKGAGHGGKVFSDEERFQIMLQFLQQHL